MAEKPDYSDLSAIFLNCTLKPSGQDSHTQKLMDVATAVMDFAGASVETIRIADEDVPQGVYPDMTEHGFESDGWPAIQEKIWAADVLVIGTPIWLGQPSSLASKVIERLYGYSGELNDAGQSRFYGKAGGVIVTGNEDGIKHVGMEVLYSLQHIGYAIPPQADAGWIGEAGPGPSYGDDGAGESSDFTQKNTTFMAWNLLHLAALQKRAGGFPNYGNDRNAWSDGTRFGHPNPEYR